MKTHRSTMQSTTALLCIDTATGRVTRYCGRRQTHGAMFGADGVVWKDMGTPEYREVLETMRATPERIPGLS
jgi:hypothetical protein